MAILNLKFKYQVGGTEGTCKHFDPYKSSGFGWGGAGAETGTGCGVPTSPFPLTFL